MPRGVISSTWMAVVCAAGLVPTARAQVAEVDVQPRSITLGVGERKEVLATAYDRGGNVAEVKFQWRVVDASVVRVEEDQSVPGLAYFIGITAGATQVEVRGGSHAITVQVEVRGSAIPGVVAGTGTAVALEVDPAQISLYPGEDLQLVPRFLREDGQAAAPLAVTWTSLRPEVAAVDQTGKVTGISNGPAIIQVNAAGLPPRSVQVQVGTAPWAFNVRVVSLSPTEADTVRISVPSQGHRPLDPRRLSWSTEDRSVAVVTPLGVVTGISGGRTNLVVKGFGQESRLPVTVHREVTSLSVRSLRGDTVTVPLGGSARFAATALAADDTPVLDAPLVWEPGDTTVLRYAVPDSAAHGLKIGTTTLTLTGPGHMTRRWVIRVVAAGLVVQPDRVGLSKGTSRLVAASFADASGTPLSPASQVTWASSDPAVARVTVEGRIEAVAPGRADVVASTPWGNADTVTVFVTGSILVASTRGGSADIFAFDPGTPADFQPVVSSPAREYSPAYSPDGTRLAFATDRDGNAEIYVADVDGQHVTRLTDTPATEDDPSWTADGRRLVYMSNADGTVQIWSMSADGSDQRQLTRGAGLSQGPVVSPGGGRVAFTTTRDGNYDVYVMELDGSNARNVTASPSNEIAVQWVGDSALAFLREERSGAAVTRMVMRMPLAGGVAASLTPSQLLIREFAITPDGGLVVAVVETPGPSGTAVFRLFLIPADGAVPTEVPRSGDRDLLVTPAVRR